MVWSMPQKRSQITCGGLLPPIRPPEAVWIPVAALIGLSSLLAACLMLSCGGSNGLSTSRDASNDVELPFEASVVPPDAIDTDAGSTAGNLFSELVAECKLPPNPGSCSDSIDRYYFDQNAYTCLPFKYSGCGGNGNSFPTKSGCQRYCTGGIMCTCPDASPGCSTADGCAACPVDSNYADGTDCSSPGLSCNDGIPCTCVATVSGSQAWACIVRL